MNRTDTCLALVAGGCAHPVFAHLVAIPGAPAANRCTRGGCLLCGCGEEFREAAPASASLPPGAVVRPAPAAAEQEASHGYVGRGAPVTHRTAVLSSGGEAVVVPHSPGSLSPAAIEQGASSAVECREPRAAPGDGGRGSLHVAGSESASEPSPAGPEPSANGAPDCGRAAADGPTERELGLGAVRPQSILLSDRLLRATHLGAR